MPGRPASWIPRVPVIQKALENSTADRLTRAEVEQLFSVSASQAKTIIAVAGGKLTNGVLAIPRQKLLDYVRFSPEAAEHRADEERRAEVGRKLAEARKDLGLRKIAIETAPGDAFSTLDDVLQSFSFEPGVVRIAHSGTEDLVRTMYRLGQALGIPDAYERFQKLVETEQEGLKARGA